MFEDQVKCLSVIKVNNKTYALMTVMFLVLNANQKAMKRLNIYIGAIA